MKLADLILRDAIITDLEATSKGDALREIVRRVQGAGHFAGVDRDDLVDDFLGREGLGSTAIGRGLAVPECHHPRIDRTVGIVALSRRGVEFAALDEGPVDILFPLFAPPFTHRPNRPGDGGIGWAWEGLAPYAKDEEFLGRLRRCGTPEEVWSAIEDADRKVAGATTG
jgi:mannitol/fructose-specific phosphotransferase system IIA component (Ntr-type)